MMKRFARLPLLLVLLAPSCNHDPDEGIQDDLGLREFRSCLELEGYIKDQALKEMDARIDALIEGDYGPIFRGEGPVATAPAPAPNRSDSATDFTTTNNQERGVDEADFVKNDGARAFVLHGRTLVKLATWPPEATRLEWTEAIEGWPIEMLMERDRVAVFSRVNLWAAFARGGFPPPSAVRCQGPDAYCTDGLKVTLLDVTAAPRVLYELYLPGAYVSSRRVGSHVRVVSTGGLVGPELKFHLDQYLRDPDARRAAWEAVRARNAALIRATPLEVWLPRNLQVSGGQARLLEHDCADFRATTAPAGLGLTTVSALNLAARGSAPGFTSILNPADKVYASTRSLYVTTQHWWRPGIQLPQEHTYIHQFDTVSNPARVRYMASGGVSGHIADQFSMSEHDGSLRVATTQLWRVGNTQRLMSAPTNAVHVLRPGGGRLATVGTLTGLAPDERIYSARFLGDRGFLVTFRMIDPLFTLDLSDPRQPRLVGELKVPGFSTYLHPIDEGHLLAIGRETVDLGGGRIRVVGLALQVFDVSDFANPRLQHKQVFGAWSSSSEAEQEHKAFNYFPSRGLLAIPFSDWRPSSRTASFRSSLEVFGVSVAQGIAPVGSVDHGDLARAGAPDGHPPYSPRVRRSIMMDDFVYSISLGGVKVSPASDLDRTLVAVPLPRPEPDVRRYPGL